MQTNRFILENNTQIQTLCYHCGSECPNQSIEIDNHYFCCEGCKTVFQVLNNNQLCDYYAYNSQPGIKQNNSQWAERYAFLDRPEYWDEFISFKEKDQCRVQFYIPQMHCSSCIWLLENLFKLNEGIISNRVNFSTKELFLVFDAKKISLRQLVELLTSIGYEPKLEIQDLKLGLQLPKRNRVLKIGIAGFCFANIMMFSLPEYFNGGELVEQDLAILFRLFIFILSLPVLFFCATEFFSGAWNGLKLKMITIDLPIALALILTFSRSIYEMQIGLSNGYLDSFSGIVFFMLLGRFIQDKSFTSLSFDRNYKSFFPIAVMAMKKSKWISTPIEAIEKNDRILIHNEEIIPVDGLLLNGKASLDYSFVSGESQLSFPNCGERVYAGARQTGEAIEISVIKPVSQSYLTNLWNNEIFKTEKAKTYKEIDLIAQYFTLVVIVLALAAGVYWYTENRPDLMWNAVTTILIVACPCALLLAASFTNGNLLRILSKNKLYLKHPSVLDQLNQIDHLVFDKTGTLTKNGSLKVLYCGTKLSQDQEIRFYSLAKQSTHPLSHSVAQYIQANQTIPVLEFKQIPGKGIEAWIQEHHVILGSADFVKAVDPENEDQSTVHIKEDGNYLGYFSIAQEFRSGLDVLFDKLKSKYKLSMLTGDQPGATTKLLGLFQQKNALHFGLKPIDKLDFISKHQQKQGEKILMVGDGLNDSGALKQSDVGIAVTENRNNFTPASDGILDGSSLQKLADMLLFVRDGKRTIYLIFIYSILYNIIGGYFALNGILSPLIAAILMPISSISILLLSYGITAFLAWHRRLS
ncbi:MAG: heavy metal translocating P-type ATPase metal-binding domain-containing protein [Saprospiraceae bacterium]|nr:heavy metal translocating P-type ATPase metal-binding domain-containing protein [Saprospiraceae bacterium]MBK7738684.1 heavy metal translocating P-type ATPase metal-binding domain-containing protein [Saprospiraceae bacterium]MBK7912744.1 heavy metal translocating P-type ATPase metal-binding domain-containing protein [Saprospiraceae bacterium]